MNKINTSEFPSIRENGYWKKIKNLYYEKGKEQYNSGNLHIKLYGDIGSKNLLVVTGESWTFGDSLKPFVMASKGKDNVPYRLTNTFSARLANYMNCDLLLIATPGIGNNLILSNLKNGLEEITKIKKYSNIYNIVQFTSPGRDIIRVKDSTPFNSITTGVHNFSEWVVKYEEIYLNEYLKLSDKYNFKKQVFWKNFYDFELDINNYQSNKISFIEKNWSKFLFELAGISSKFAQIMELQVDFSNIDYIKNDTDFLIENSNNFEDYINNLNHSPLNDYHPTVSGHWLWAKELSKHLP